jgi:hypothetical protein
MITQLLLPFNEMTTLPASDEVLAQGRFQEYNANLSSVDISV